MEIAYIDVPEDATGSVIQKLTQRKGTLNGMSPLASGYTRLEFEIPSRGLIGYRGEFLTDTKGNGILNTEFEGYGEYRGDLNYRHQGSLIAFEQGELLPTAYSRLRTVEPFLSVQERRFTAVWLSDRVRSPRISS